MGRSLLCRALPPDLREAPALVAVAIGILAAVSGESLPPGTARSSSSGSASRTPRPVSVLARGRPPRPTVKGALSPPARVRLDDAFVLAVRAVEDVPACRALFEPLGADPTVELVSTVYSDASDWSPACAPRVAAFTVLGSPATSLCPAFQHLEADEASIILIHEALHAAGLAESPPTAGAMTAVEINRMVRTYCRASPAAQPVGAGRRIPTGNAIQSR